MGVITEPARETSVIRETGVLVVGSGPGVEVTLVERFGCFGGNATAVGVEGRARYRHEKPYSLPQSCAGKSEEPAGRRSLNRRRLDRPRVDAKHVVLRRYRPGGGYRGGDVHQIEPVGERRGRDRGPERTRPARCTVSVSFAADF